MKRGAENQLTKDVRDDSDDEIEVLHSVNPIGLLFDLFILQELGEGTFKRADETILASRPFVLVPALLLLDV